MPEARATLEAGGLLPAGTPTPDDLPTDTVDARGYVHPSIAGRVVVRLVPDAIARGIDTEMELLGFSLGQHADDIAIQRRRALGFPGATLVEDPERARYALDVMREFKQHAKRITSKPGHAKDGFDEIASRLQRQVPHFLPSYWEEVARAFANGGNLTYAAQSFDKARTAEREFGLTVDEERRGEAFLEFALMGALTVKSLQAYGKELSQTAGPKVAYERMFSLATRRTLGGIPPWASMPKDLRTLVKAAKLDAKAEEQRLLRELLSASSLKRAPASFWNEYRNALVALGMSDPAVRSKLLDLFPNGGKARWAWNRDESGFSDTWMGVLADAGALEVLWDADAPADAVPSGGRVAWLERLQEWSHFGEGWVLQIVRRAAPLLRGGPPVKVLGGDYYKPLDIDLVDLLIELGIPWTLSTSARVDLAKWATGQPCEARAGLAAEHRPRDPIHAAADEATAQHLGPAVDAVFGNASFEAVAAGMKGLADLRRRWLHTRIGDLDRTGLTTSTLSLSRLEAATSADHFAEFPDAVEPLADASIARALARTLALGIFEELRWPAWEQAITTLGLEKLENVHVHRQFPHLLLATTRKLLVLGRDGVELEHDLKHGFGDNLPNNTLFVGGSALVVWSYWHQGSKNLGYWSHAANDTWECQGNWSRGQAYPIEHADSVIYGETRVSRGDRVAHPPHGHHQGHDATGAWVVHDQDIRAQDRNTGAVGAPARPAFLAEAHWNPSDWCYVAVDAPDSPLGVVEGQYGWRWIRPGNAADPDLDLDDDEEAPTELTLLTLAGDRRVGQIRVGQGAQMPTAMVRWPGADRARPVAETSQYWRRQHNVDVVVGDPDVPEVALSRMEGAQLSASILPPIAYWHFLVPTDASGSQRLRKVDVDDASRLIAAARAAG
ncbi:MAG: hypothetical protein KC621_29925, partial [Myxococcales bacterium]|nr:hypothetical protein [Myxococcales bacterium]